MLQKAAGYGGFVYMSQYGEALAERREVVGYERQGQLAAASAKLADEHPSHFQAFSQQWLSRLESDRTGHAIQRAQPLRLAALAFLLRWGSGEFYARVGVVIAPVPLLDKHNADSVIPIKIHRIPIRNMAAASEKSFYSECMDSIAYVDDRFYRRDMEVVCVSGDSMEPTFMAGDEVYIDTQDKDLHHGKVYLIHIIGDGFLLKRAQRMGDTWALTSDNSISYPPIFPNRDTEVVGRAYYRQPKGDEL